MVRRLCIVCFLVALWPGPRFGAVGCLDGGTDRDTLYRDDGPHYRAQGRYAEAEPLYRRLLPNGQCSLDDGSASALRPWAWYGGANLGLAQLSHHPATPPADHGP